MEDLRKAKNNTILKREREILQVGAPGLGRTSGVETSKYKELEHKYHLLEKRKVELEDESHAITIKRDAWKEKYNNLDRILTETKESRDLEIARAQAVTREYQAKCDDLMKELVRLREKLEVKATQEETKTKENR